MTTYSIDNILNLSIVPAIKEEPHNHGEYIYFDYKKLYKESHLELLLKHSFGIMYQSHLNNNKIKWWKSGFKNVTIY